MESSQYLRREDFKNDEDYGEYIKLLLRPNMIVRALCDYESVVKGDIGVCKQANSEMPLAQFKWIKAGEVEVKTYSVYWYMVEILSDDEDESMTTNKTKQINVFLLYIYFLLYSSWKQREIRSVQKSFCESKLLIISCMLTGLNM